MTIGSDYFRAYANAMGKSIRATQHDPRQITATPTRHHLSTAVAEFPAKREALHVTGLVAPTH